VGTITTALATANIQITDALHDYDQGENLYRVLMELTVTNIAASSLTLPAAMVYPVARVGNPSTFDNYTKQFVRQEFAILIMTDDANIPALQNEIQAALVGWQQSAAHHEMEYSSGASIEGVGNLSMWREVYTDAFYMTQT
jgi:hypothetical protein